MINSLLRLQIYYTYINCLKFCYKNIYNYLYFQVQGLKYEDINKEVLPEKEIVCLQQGTLNLHSLQTDISIFKLSKF